MVSFRFLCLQIFGAVILIYNQKGSIFESNPHVCHDVGVSQTHGALPWLRGALSHSEDLSGFTCMVWACLHNDGSGIITQLSGYAVVLG